VTQRQTTTTRNHGDFFFGLKPRANRKAISHIEALGFRAPIIDKNSAVGQDAVRVQNEKLNVVWGSDLTHAARVTQSAKELELRREFIKRFIPCA
jgi:hypothetical protein